MLARCRRAAPLLMAGSSMALVMVPRSPGLLMGGGRSAQAQGLASAHCPASRGAAANRGLKGVRRVGRQGRPALFSERLRGGSGEEGPAHQGPGGATGGGGRAGKV
jgi:hypothetical protein